MQHQPEACVLDLSDDSHITCNNSVDAEAE